MGGREVEKVWLGGRREEGNCCPLGCTMHGRFGGGGGPEKVKTNTNGGAQRYTSNQRQTLMKVSGNVSDIPGPQANK